MNKKVKRTILNWLILATVLSGISLTFVACSDDDNNTGDGTDESKEQVMADGVSDDATVLASLLQEWCDFNPSGISADILSQTFVPTVGEVAELRHPSAGQQSEQEHLSLDDRRL